MRLNSDTSTFRSAGGDECGGARCLQDMLLIQIVRIGISCFLARENPNADPDVDSFCRGLDYLLFENNGIIDLPFKINVGIVTATFKSRIQVGLQVLRRDAVILKEDGFVRFHYSAIFPFSSTGPTT